MAGRHANMPKPAGQLPPAADRAVDFVKDVQPIFQVRCYDCHGEKKQNENPE